MLGIHTDDIQFFNFNTEESRKLFEQNKEEMTVGMTLAEKKAFMLGANNAFSIMEQLLECGETDNNIQFYKRGKIKEFTLDELVGIIYTRKGLVNCELCGEWCEPTPDIVMPVLMVN